MEHLKQKYLDEARDLLMELEKSLLSLEKIPSDIPMVDQVFRVMHTLKGCSSMFGYQKVGELTHLLENCFDNIREKKTKAGSELIGLSFAALDHIRYLLKDPDLRDIKARELHVSILEQLNELCDDASPPGKGSYSAAIQQEEKTFYIWFEPHKGIMQNGSNPFYILEDVAQLGRLQTFVSYRKIPLLEEMDPQLTYLSWGMLLSTAESLSSVQEAFLFVEHLCELEIVELANGDLIQHLDEKTIQELEDRFATQAGRMELQALIEEITRGRADQETATMAEEANNEELLKSRAGSSIRVTSDKLDDLMNMISELVAGQARLSLLAEQNILPELNAVAEEMGKIIRRLRDKTFDICLVPIENILTRFRRLVRDLSKEMNKQIAFEVEGVETELDKNVVEQLTESLVHIFRNAIDHGIEEESDRIATGKDAQGKILLRAYNSGTNVFIEIKDDGAGIDLEKVKQKAIEKGLIHGDEILSRQEVIDLLFVPGFSTARQVTEVSGRGVGMDVVRRKIRELRGEVSLHSITGEGTTVTISLPLTISIIDGLLVRVGGTDFVLPLSYVKKSYAIGAQDRESERNKQLVLDGELLPYFDLSEELSSTARQEQAFAILITAGQQKVALLVDEIIGEYQAVLKPLGSFYKEQDFLAGASLKGDGTVALVLDPQRLLNELAKQIIQI